MPAKLVVNPGEKYGRLTIIIETDPVPCKNSRGVKRMFICQCECGVFVPVHIVKLRNGHTKSCGCLQSETLIRRNTKHGLSKKIPEYGIWVAIKARCHNPKHIAAKNYSKRGITVCNEWINDFPRFIKDMGRRPSPQHSIERRDNDKEYSPDNCYWATPIEQANNTRKNVFLEIDGTKKTISQWARLNGISQSVAATRRYRGWCNHCAVTLKKREGSCDHC